MGRISKVALGFAALFLLLALVLILRDGLFGESFIALTLGMPWVLVLSYFEFFNPRSEVLLGILLVIPILLNAVLVYFAAALIEWGIRRK